MGKACRGVLHVLLSRRCQRKPGNRLSNRVLHGLTVVGVLGIIGGIPCPRPAGGGTLEVHVTDHREAIKDFRQLEVVIATLRIRPHVGLRFWQSGWKDLQPSVDKIDLTQYTGPRSALIFSGEVTPGSFEGIHVQFAGGEGLLEKTQRTVPIRSRVGPMPVAFTVEPTGVTRLILDLTVVDMSDHPPGGYELQVKGYELYVNGKLVAKVPPRER